MVNNFFLARTETLRDIRWDERFKIYGEHNDFFLRYSAKYRVTYTDKVVIDHHEGGYSFLGKIGSIRREDSSDLREYSPVNTASSGLAESILRACEASSTPTFRHCRG